MGLSPAFWQRTQGQDRITCYKSASTPLTRFYDVPSRMSEGRRRPSRNETSSVLSLHRYLQNLQFDRDLWRQLGSRDSRALMQDCRRGPIVIVAYRGGGSFQDLGVQSWGFLDDEKV
jgi:hypothetical protein